MHVFLGFALIMVIKCMFKVLLSCLANRSITLWSKSQRDDKITKPWNLPVFSSKKCPDFFQKWAFMKNLGTLAKGCWDHCVKWVKLGVPSFSKSAVFIKGGGGVCPIQKILIRKNWGGLKRGRGGLSFLTKTKKKTVFYASPNPRNPSLFATMASTLRAELIQHKSSKY